MKRSKEELENLKTRIEGNNEMDSNLKNQMLEKINNALTTIDRIINLIPSTLRQYFEQREVMLQQPFDQIDLINLIISNPDRFQGATECQNFSKHF